MSDAAVYSLVRAPHAARRTRGAACCLPTILGVAGPPSAAAPAACRGPSCSRDQIDPTPRLCRTLHAPAGTWNTPSPCRPTEKCTKTLGTSVYGVCAPRYVGCTAGRACFDEYRELRHSRRWAGATTMSRPVVISAQRQPHLCTRILLPLRSRALAPQVTCSPPSGRVCLPPSDVSE